MQVSQFSGVTSMEMSLQPKNMKKDGRFLFSERRKHWIYFIMDYLLRLFTYLYELHPLVKQTYTYICPPGSNSKCLLLCLYLATLFVILRIL